MTLPTTRENNAGRHLFLGFQGTVWTESLRFRLQELRPGGLVLFRRNIQDGAQLTELIREANAWAQDQLGWRLLWAVDEEGGSVQRLSSILGPAPAALELAEEGEEALCRCVSQTANGLRRLGIQINLAPVLDVVEDPHEHFLGSRALGKSPDKIAQLGTLWVQSLQENGVAATAKHFPGLGTARRDPHDHCPVVEASSADKARRDLAPFRQAVRCGVRAVMTSHAVYPFWDPDWPGTLSQKINKGLLRDTWGFGGLLLSDDVDMQAIGERYEPETVVRCALLGTVDGLLVCQNEAKAEVFARALHDGIRRHRDLQEAHLRSLDRLDSLWTSFF